MADDGAFHDGANGVGRGNVGFRKNEGKAAKALAFQSAHGGARQFAQLDGGKILSLAPAEQEQAFRLQSGGAVQEGGFEGFARDFATSDYFFGSCQYGGIGGLDGRRRLIAFVVTSVERYYGQAIGFQLRRSGGS